MFSHHTSQLVKALAVVAALAAVVATPAHASASHRPYVDGWAFNAMYNATHPTAAVDLVSEHGFGQNASDVQVAADVASVGRGLDWRAAAIGVLVGTIATATTVLILRRGRTRLATS